jgi:hypothetical protein
MSDYEITSGTPEFEHNWSTFGMCFVGMFPYIPHDEAPPTCSWKVGDTLSEIDRDFRRVEAPYVAEIEKIIRSLCRRGNAPAGSEESQYFLGLRAAVLAPFLLSHAVPIQGGALQTILPFPQLPTLRVLEWFLIDWWNRHGPQRICEYRHLEDTLPIE